jgi:LacI family transcriptional regulator
MNLKELSKKINISVSTVSRVLSGQGDKYRISQKTQAFILAEAQASGVVADALGRSLRLKTTRTIGLVIPDIANPFFASLARQIEHQSRKRGYSVLIADSQEDYVQEQKCVNELLSRRIDGLILAPVGAYSAKLKCHFSRYMPWVQIDRVEKDINADAIFVDNFLGSYMAVKHFIELGHQRIGCLVGKEENSVCNQRVEGYKAALSEANIAFDEKLLLGGSYSIEIGMVSMNELLAMNNPPTAVIAMGNLPAIGALQSIRDHQMKIPEDISFISFDEQSWSQLASPPITTINQPVVEMGTVAADLLFERLQTKKQMPRVFLSRRLDVSIVMRQSTGPLKVKNKPAKKKS